MPEQCAPPTYRVKAVLPLGLIAISSASVLIKLCDAPPLVIAAYRLTLAVIFLFPFTLHRNVGEFRRRPKLLQNLDAIVSRQVQVEDN